MSTEADVGRPGPAARRAWLVSTNIKSLDTNRFGLHVISSDGEWMTVRIHAPSRKTTDELEEAKLQATFAASPYPSVLLVQYANDEASLIGAGLHAPSEPWRLARPEQGVAFQTLRPPAEWIRWSAEVASALPSVINLPKGVMAEGLELARWVLMEAGIMLLDEELMSLPVDGFGGGASSSTGRAKAFVRGELINMRLERYVLGHGKDRWGRFMGIWDRAQPEKPIRRYPLVFSGFAKRAYWRLARPDNLPKGEVFDE